MTIGPLPGSPARGLSSGCASARITSAASTVRMISSQSGVRAGVSSRATRSRSRRIAGNWTILGLGGVSLSSHHRIGRTIRAPRIQGTAKAIGPSPSMIQLVGSWAIAP